MNEVVDCQQCSRLVDYLQQIKKQYPDYYCRPVAAFGDDKAGLLIVGLAPGLHGANATGRPFTGDAAGTLLYQTLYNFGFSSKPQSSMSDGDFQLYNCRITNAVKCLPPQNKPVAEEINQCNHFLAAEIKALEEHSVILALGQVAHKAIIKSLNLRQADYAFAHAAEFDITPGLSLIDSYHCSRYNTQTRRLTETMFRGVFERIRLLPGHE